MEMTRQHYEKKVEGHLKQWSTRVAALQAKAEQATEATKKDLMSELAEFKKVQAQGTEHLAAVQKAAADTWKDVQKGLTDTWNHVSGAADAIWARVK
jgi:phage shock protein A